MRLPALAALLAALCLRALAAQGNVLLLVADDVGIDKLRCYHASPSAPPTPNLDALAAQGVRFQNAWANPACSATRAAILTGRYSFRTGVGFVVGEQCPPLPLAEWTLPELLDLGGSAPYAHALIGKWHLGTVGVGDLLAPNLAGFQHYAGTLDNLGTFTYQLWPKVVDGAEELSTHYVTTDQVDEALQWIAQAPEPWFCQLSFSAAHAPFSAPPQNLITQGLPGPTPHGDPKPFYDATVEAMDTEIGRLLHSLPAGTLADTLVLFLGDNGTPPEASVPPFTPEHAKLSMYEGGLRVPLIAFGAAVKEPGRVVAHPVHAVDLFATIASAAGVAPAQTLPAGTAIDSVSLLPYLTKPTSPALRSEVFSELFLSGAQGKTQQKYALRGARYKLIRQGSPPKDEFYDLQLDPFELHNLYGAGMSPELKRQYRKLTLALAKLLQS